MYSLPCLPFHHSCLPCEKVKSVNWRTNIYEENKTVGAIINPLMPAPDAVDEAFAATANEMLFEAAGLLRQLVPSHQSAIAIVVNKDWKTVRKYFSLSEKYAAWKHYAEPAVGYGIHNYLLQFNQVVRLTQAELEAHPEWKGFGLEAGKHPPMRGWLAAPLIDNKGVNWGLLQLSDKVEGEYDEDDEMAVRSFAKLVSLALEAAWDKRNLAKEKA